MSLNRSQSSDNLSFSWESRVEKPEMSWDIKPWPAAPAESRRRISWDNKPWVASKERLHRDQMINKPGGLMCNERSPRVAPERDFLVLPPPPCRSDSIRRRSVHVAGYGGGNLIIPGILQPPSMRGSPKKGYLKKEEDPFLAAYIECTKSVKPIKEGGRKGGFLGLISCKRGSCGDVREEGVVKVRSQKPAPAAAHPRDVAAEREGGRGCEGV